jgi:hypothetical protein
MLISDDVLNYAIEGRRALNRWLDNINIVRKKLGLDPINKRDNYITQIMDESFLHKILPDVSLGEASHKFVKAGKKFNPRELARTQDLAFDERVQGLTELLQRYIGVAADELFLNPQIRNVRMMARHLEENNLRKAALWLNEYVDEAYLGKHAPSDALFAKSRGGRALIHGSKAFKGFMGRTVFPANFAWNLGTQTSSAALIAARYPLRDIRVAIGRLATDVGSGKKWINELKRTYSYQTKIKGGTARHQDLSQFADTLAKIEKSGLDKFDEKFASAFTNATEAQLSLISNAVAWTYFERLGFTGRALRELASEGAAKTQSMYTHLERPGFLRGHVWTAFNPFQTFSFTMANTFFREAFINEGLRSMPVRNFVRGMSAIAATNMVMSEITGRSPYSISAWVPYYGTIVEPTFVAIADMRPEDALDYLTSKIAGVPYEPPPGSPGLRGTRGLPAPAGLVKDVLGGVRDISEHGDWRRFIRTTARYAPGTFGVPGGVAYSRLADAGVAMSRDWEQRSVRGDVSFTIEDPMDKFFSFFVGPWGTRPGMEYLRDRRVQDFSTKWSQYIIDTKFKRATDATLEEMTPRERQMRQRMDESRERMQERLEIQEERMKQRMEIMRQRLREREAALEERRR